MQTEIKFNEGVDVEMDKKGNKEVYIDIKVIMIGRVGGLQLEEWRWAWHCAVSVEWNGGVITRTCIFILPLSASLFTLFLPKADDR